jgi:hypothetical protein
MLRLPSFYQRSVNFNLFFIIKLRYFVRVASALSNRFYAREGIVVSWQSECVCVANVHTLS